MKVQIDTQAKTIKVEQNVKITELLDVVKKLFPDNEWKNYTLETNTVINNPQPYVWPWASPSTFCVTPTGTSTLPCTTSEVNAASLVDVPHTFCFETN